MAYRSRYVDVDNEQDIFGMLLSLRLPPVKPLIKPISPRAVAERL